MQQKPGFGLLEALITLAIALVIASVITTIITQDRTPEDLKNISFTINNMMITARQESHAKHCAMRLHMYANSTPHKIILEQEIPNSQSPGTYTFTPATVIGGTTSYDLPATWTIKAVYNGANEQLGEYKNTATCTLAPAGVLPPLLIHLQATKSKQGATLKAEPFQKIFTLYKQLLAPPKKTGNKK